MADPKDMFMPVSGWDEMLEHAAGLVRMALAEAGHPDAEVRIEPTGIFVEGAPQEVEDRAFELVNDWYDRAGTGVVWLNDVEAVDA